MELIKISLQLEPEIAQALDEWQRQRFVRSRSSAANQLLAQALGLAAQPPISSPPQAPVMPMVAPAPATATTPPAFTTPNLSAWGK